MSKIFKGMIAAMVIACMLGVSPVHAFFVAKAVRRTVGAAKAGTEVAGRTSYEETNNKINANLAYLKESHRLDPSARQGNP